MTEAEWLASDDPLEMLPHVSKAISHRGVRLFAAACCRQVWDSLTEARHREAVEAAEAYCDGKLSDDEMKSICVRANDPGFQQFKWAACVTATPPTESVAIAVQAAEYSRRDLSQRRQPAQADALRCILGNPFRRLTEERWRFTGRSRPLTDVYYDPAWFTPQAQALARAAHEDRPAAPCRRCEATGRATRVSVGDRPADGKCPSCGGRLQVRDDISAVVMWWCHACGLAPKSHTHEDCRHCAGKGCVPDGTLDPLTLCALADALEEAGCPTEMPTEKVERFCRHCFADRGYCAKCESKRKVWSACEHCDDTKWVWIGMDNLKRIPCAKCPSPQPHPLLAHLRDKRPHYRGCHVVDAVLGRG